MYIFFFFFNSSPTPSNCVPIFDPMLIRAITPYHRQYHHRKVRNIGNTIAASASAYRGVEPNVVTYTGQCYKRVAIKCTVGKVNHQKSWFYPTSKSVN